MSGSLQPHGLQHARSPFPSLSPGVCSNSCPLSRSCHQSLHPLSYPFSCLQSFPTSGSFPVSQLFTWGGQNIGTSASASVLPLNIQGWFPLGLTSWVSLLSKALKNLLQHHKFKSINSLVLSLLYVPWLLEKRWFWLSGPLSTKWCLCCLGLP